MVGVLELRSGARNWNIIGLFSWNFMDPPTRREVFSRSVSWKYEASDLNSNEAGVAQ